MGKNKHDEYGKGLFKELLGNERWESPLQQVHQGGKIKAQLDGGIKSRSDRLMCVVEIVAGRHKQVTGAIVNLALYENASKKLLVLIPARSTVYKNKENWIDHCHYIWRHIASEEKHGDFEVICLEGTGRPESQKWKEDIERLRMALQKLDKNLL
jgi:hypothetical protein